MAIPDTSKTKAPFLFTGQDSAFQNNSSQQDQSLQKLADTNPEQADLVMDKLGYTGSPNLTKVATQSVGPDGKPIYDVFAGQEHIADPTDPRLKGIDISTLPEGTAPTGFKSKFEQGFQKANEVLGDKAMDVKDGSIVQNYAPKKRNDLASGFVQSDPFVSGLVQTWQDYINPQNQRASLADTYKQMIKDSGIEALDMELIDTKNIIEGTEDDLRTEITKAGGFATNSQVQALANARNKQLIKNYNTLLDTRNAKEKYLETALTLEQADRQSADQRFESMFNMGVQIQQLQQQMQTNARNQMQWLTENVGFDGLYDATGGDPYYVDLVEQTLGLPSGGLLSSAEQAKAQRVSEEEKAQLETQLKQSQLETEALNRQKLTKEMSLLGQPKTEIAEVQGRKFLINSQTGNIIKEITPTPGGSTGDQKRLQTLDTLVKINDIQSNPGLNNAVGPNFLARWSTPLTGSKQAFVGDVQNVVDNMTLDKLINAKSQGATFGALSDNELRMIGASATKIGQWAVKDDSGKVVAYDVNESAFRKELDNIKALTARSYLLSGYSITDLQDEGVSQTPDGKIWFRNSDGTLRQLNQ